MATETFSESKFEHLLRAGDMRRFEWQSWRISSDKPVPSLPNNKIVRSVVVIVVGVIGVLIVLSVILILRPVPIIL